LPSATLRVVGRGRHRDAERPKRHSHAERGNQRRPARSRPVSWLNSRKFAFFLLSLFSSFLSSFLFSVFLCVLCVLCGESPLSSLPLPPGEGWGLGTLRPSPANSCRAISVPTLRHGAHLSLRPP